MEKLRDTMTRARYAVNVEMNVIDSEDNWREKRKMNIQEMWIAITIKQQMISLEKNQKERQTTSQCKSYL